MCGQRRLFSGWFVMVPDCPGCGLKFKREPGMWLGSWFLNICLAQVVIVVVLLVEVALTWPEPPGWPHFAVAVVVAVAVPLWFFPYSRTIWVAVDLIMRPVDFDDGVAPGVELDQIEQARRDAARASRPRGGQQGPER